MVLIYLSITFLFLKQTHLFLPILYTPSSVFKKLKRKFFKVVAALKHLNIMIKIQLGLFDLTCF